MQSLSVCKSLLWPPCVADADIIFCRVVSSSIFYLLSFFPRLISAVAEWMSTIFLLSTHGVALVRIEDARLKCAARGLLEIQDAK